MYEYKLNILRFVSEKFRRYVLGIGNMRASLGRAIASRGADAGAQAVKAPLYLFTVRISL